MVFVELPSFTRRAAELLSDDEYRALQMLLTNSPNAGRLIVGTGGARKVRWSREGSGKSGGVRVIYYYAVSREVVLMLSIYSKSEQESLPDTQKHLLRKAIERYIG